MWNHIGSSIFKYNEDDSLNYFKEHLVAKGCMQASRMDYDKTFNPMVKPTMIHLVIVLSFSLEHELIRHKKHILTQASK